MNDLVKISFPLDSTAWHGSTFETLWARSLPENSALVFEIQNTPFYSKAVSYLDVVTGVHAEQGLVFDGIVAPSGHSTYRLLVENSAPFESWWRHLEEIGCTYESGQIDTRWLYAIDIPPTTDIYAAYRIFLQAQKEGIWYFEEGHVGHKLRS